VAVKCNLVSNELSIYFRLTFRANQHSAWRATYRAIPGRIIIAAGMLQFRTTRVAGAKVLVDYDADDIVRIRKTKSIDLMLWHSNGLSLDMVDGEVSIQV
jgi:hypothetical protein